MNKIFNTKKNDLMQRISDININEKSSKYYENRRICKAAAAYAALSVLLRCTDR